jgi:serine/threonine protein kinase
MSSSPDYHHIPSGAAYQGVTPLTPRFSFSGELDPIHSVRCFLAQDRQSGSGAVVLKVLPRERAGEVSELLAFLIESHAAAKLSHRNIATSSRPEQVENFHYSVSQFPEGAETLRCVLDRKGWFEILRVVEIASQLAEALRYAHGADVLHLALQPEQVWLGGDGNVTLTGFGVPRTPERHWVQRRRSHDGNLAYRSPEQLAGNQVDERSDLYALGVVLYEMLTDMLPFHAPDADQLLQKILRQKAPPIDLIRPEVPAPLCAIVAKLIAKEAADRCASAAALQADLQRLSGSRLDSQGRVTAGPAEDDGEKAAPEFEEEESLSGLLSDLDDTPGRKGEGPEGRANSPDFVAAEVAPSDPSGVAWNPPLTDNRENSLDESILSLRDRAGETPAPLAFPVPPLAKRRRFLRYVMAAFFFGYCVGIVVLAYNGYLTNLLSRTEKGSQSASATDADKAGAVGSPAAEQSVSIPPATPESPVAGDSGAIDATPTTPSPAPGDPLTLAGVSSPETSNLRQQVRRQQPAKVSKRKTSRTSVRAGRVKSRKSVRRSKH